MIIICPNCKMKYKIEPDRFKGQIIAFRCHKCSRMLKIDKQHLHLPPKTVQGGISVSKEDKKEIVATEAVNAAEDAGQLQKPEESVNEKKEEVNVDKKPTELISPPNKTDKTEEEIPPNQAGDEDKKLAAEPDIKSSSLKSNVRKRILVADDEMSICILVDEILSSAGYDVIIARDGLEAFTRVKDEAPDLVILDLLMPKMTGFEVLKEIRQIDANIKVLVMTAIYKKASQVLVVKELGANGYLEKPFSPDHLLFRVENLLRDE